MWQRKHGVRQGVEPTSPRKAKSMMTMTDRQTRERDDHAHSILLCLLASSIHSSPSNTQRRSKQAQTHLSTSEGPLQDTHHHDETSILLTFPSFCAFFFFFFPSVLGASRGLFLSETREAYVTGLRVDQEAARAHSSSGSLNREWYWRPNVDKLKSRTACKSVEAML